MIEYIEVNRRGVAITDKQVVASDTIVIKSLKDKPKRAHKITVDGSGVVAGKVKKEEYVLKNVNPPTVRRFGEDLNIFSYILEMGQKVTFMRVIPEAKISLWSEEIAAGFSIKRVPFDEKLLTKAPTSRLIIE